MEANVFVLPEHLEAPETRGRTPTRDRATLPDSPVHVWAYPDSPVWASTCEQAALAGFIANKSPLMVATDVAARGLDIKLVTHVINCTSTQGLEFWTRRAARPAALPATLPAPCSLLWLTRRPLFLAPCVQRRHGA